MQPSKKSLKNMLYRPVLAWENLDLVLDSSYPPPLLKAKTTGNSQTHWELSLERFSTSLYNIFNVYSINNIARHALTM